VQNVVSPTFTLVNEYKSTIPIYHFDAYRIDSEGWIDAGFDEYLFADGICIIEWADNLNGILPENTIKITITKNLDNGDNYREVTIEGVDF
jgi:tRNA threonylcarbamoyladenosine biosynthesis protein TsaE